MIRSRVEPASSRTSTVTGNKTRQATFREVVYRRISSHTKSFRTKKWQLLGRIMAIDPSRQVSSSQMLLMSKMISINHLTHIRTTLFCQRRILQWSLAAQIERLFRALKQLQAAFSTLTKIRDRATIWGISVVETWGTWTYRTSSGHATRPTNLSCSIWVDRMVLE